jgi:tetratricopeptide (TPR) repeat protein
MDLGENEEAIGCFSRLLNTRPGAHFASVIDGLTTYQAHHHLGLALAHQGKQAEAEKCWRQALQANPRFLLSWRCLADLYVKQGRWQDLWETVTALEGAGEEQAHMMRLRKMMPGGWTGALPARS